MDYLVRSRRFAGSGIGGKAAAAAWARAAASGHADAAGRARANLRRPPHLARPVADRRLAALKEDR